MDKKLLEEIHKVLKEASSLSAISYNMGWLDGQGLKKEKSGVTRKQYEKLETKIDNLIVRAKNKLHKLIKKAES